MLDKLVEQTQTAIRPLGELMALNVKAVERMVEQQSHLLTGVMNDGVSYAKHLVEQKDMAGVYNAQKEYLECVQEKFINVTKDMYNVISETQDKAGDVIKGAKSDIKPVTPTSASSSASATSSRGAKP